MQTIDLRKQLKYLYQPSAKNVELIEAPPLQFAMIDGAIEKGESPGSSKSFAESMKTLYGISYTLKFMLKKRTENAVDYPVMALEGLWWVEDGQFDIMVKDNWYYTVMILQPDVVTPSVFAEGMSQLRKKQGISPALEKLRLESFTEGLCVQTMHIGPYATEPATLEKMRQFMQEHGYEDLVGKGGKHHEIYLGDPRKAAPEKLKTVLRHPVQKAG